jgi:hypothetical protein
MGYDQAFKAERFTYDFKGFAGVMIAIEGDAIAHSLCMAVDRMIR